MIKEAKIKIMACHVQSKKIPKGWGYGLCGAAASPAPKLSAMELLLAMACREAVKNGFELKIGIAPMEGEKAEPQGAAPETH